MRSNYKKPMRRMLGCGCGRLVIPTLADRLSSMYNEHGKDASRCGYRMESWTKGCIRFLTPMEHITVHPGGQSDINSNLRILQFRI